jgi:hypothetical protein
MGEEEAVFSCPYCGETISMVLDLSVSSQKYVEDCEVCCRPIEVSYTSSDGTLTSVFADRAY